MSFADLPNWAEDDPRGLFTAFHTIDAHLALGKGYKSGALGLTGSELHCLAKASNVADLTSASSARLFFEQAAVPFKIEPKDNGQGFVTGFYEPAIEVARTQSKDFPFPIYRRPPDLVDIKNLEGNNTLDPSFAFARKRGDVIDVYPNRQEIESGYLRGQGLEIAWAKSKVEVFFVHIQGAARLLFNDGSVQRITYDGKSGHPFTPIGRLLIERGEIDRLSVSMQTIRDWLLSHPDQADEVMWNNHSFIFFREADVASDDQGPIAAFTPLAFLSISRHLVCTIWMRAGVLQG
jgi:membrane-bound lytic murein transglycosylase A